MGIKKGSKLIKGMLYIFDGETVKELPYKEYIPSERITDDGYALLEYKDTGTLAWVDVNDGGITRRPRFSSNTGDFEELVFLKKPDFDRAVDIFHESLENSMSIHYKYIKELRNKREGLSHFYKNKLKED